MLTRLADWCVPDSALWWNHLTGADDFAWVGSVDRGMVKRVPPGTAWRLPADWKGDARDEWLVGQFILGYLSEFPEDEREHQLANLYAVSQVRFRDA